MLILNLREITHINPFDCGDADLNAFLMDDARFYDEQLLAHTYVVQENDETMAYFSILNDKISQSDLDKSLWRKLRKNIPHEKHYDSYPAVKIGRFAVAKQYSKQGIGMDLLDFIKRALASNTGYSACRFLTVDAYRGALPFYEKNGFLPLLKESPADMPTIPLYYDLMKAKRGTE